MQRITNKFKEWHHINTSPGAVAEAKNKKTMTKEQALQILQEAIDRGIDPDEDVEIFDAIKIAIEWLQSDPDAPDWSQAPRRRAGEKKTVTVKLPKI